MGQICRSPWQTSWNILPPKHAHTNTCTNRRTNRKHNASNPIYWIGRGMKSKEIQSFSTLNQSAISKLQNRLLTQRVWPRRPTQPPTFKEKEKKKENWSVRLKRWHDWHFYITQLNSCNGINITDIPLHHYCKFKLNMMAIHFQFV